MDKLTELQSMLTPVKYGKNLTFDDIKAQFKTLPNSLGQFVLDSSMRWSVNRSDYSYRSMSESHMLKEILFQESRTAQFLEYRNPSENKNSFHSRDKGEYFYFDIDVEKAVPFLIKEFKLNEEEFIKISIEYALRGGNKDTKFTSFKKYMKKVLSTKNLDFVLNCVDMANLPSDHYLSNYSINGFKQFLFLIRDNFEKESDKALTFVKKYSHKTEKFFKEGTKEGAWFKDYLVSLGEKKEELIFTLPHETHHEVTEKFYIKHDVVNEYFFEKGQSSIYRALIKKIIPDVVFTDDCFFVSASDKDALDTKLSKFEKILTFILEEVKPFSIQKRLRYVQEKYVQMSNSQFNILAEKILLETRIKDEKENLEGKIQDVMPRKKVKI